MASEHRSPLDSYLSRNRPRTVAPALPLLAFASRVLGLDLSPAMQEIMRASGRPGIATVAVRAGARGGKTSRLIASKALHAAWTTPIPAGFARGEIASCMLVAPDMSLAQQGLSFVVGLAQSSELASAIVGEPTRHELNIRRPDGVPVRIEVKAASSRGKATRGRTLLFAGLDEASFFRDELTGAVNDQDVYDSLLPRLVPGGQVWVVSTPWIARTGLLERLVDEQPPGTYAATATTRQLNPSWDPDGHIEATLRATDPDKAKREIDAIPLSSTAVNFFDAEAIDRAIDRDLVLPRRALPGEFVGAGGDFGFRSDSSAAVVVHADAQLVRVGDLVELRPSGQPLVPSATIREIATRLIAHAGLTHLVADQHYQETVAEYLAESGLGFVPAPLDVAETYIRARALLREGRVRIPNHHRLVAQLRSVQWRPNPGGSISIILPRERTGGHCDLVSALVLALWQAADVEVPEPAPVIGSTQYYAAEEARILARMEARQLERMRDRAHGW